MTRWPLASSHAVTSAFPGASELTALIRSPTVSLPVELYVVVNVPSLTEKEPCGTKPRPSSGVPAVNGAVPVPVAAVVRMALGVVLVELAAPEPEDPLPEVESLALELPVIWLRAS